MRRADAPTQDINVRQGIAYAIDKQLLTDEVMLGQAKRLCSVFPETSWVYNPDVPCYDYNVDTAIAEFEAAGYTFDGRQDAGRRRQAAHAQADLRPQHQQGPRADRGGRPGLSQGDRHQRGDPVAGMGQLPGRDPSRRADWDMFIGGWRATIEPHIMYTIWAEDSIPDLELGGLHQQGRGDSSSQEGGATYDTAVRKEKYGEVQKIIADESPYIFLFYSKAWSGAKQPHQGHRADRAGHRLELRGLVHRRKPVAAVSTAVT